MNFVSGIDSTARPTFSKRRRTATSARTGVQAICSRMVFYYLSDRAACLGRVVEAGRFSDIGLSGIASKLSLPCVLAAAVATSCNMAFKEWSKTGGFQTACAALDARETKGPSR